MRFPMAAAAIVVIPNATPSSASIISPARIMMALSMKPKPTKGTDDASPTIHSCCRVGSVTLLCSLSRMKRSNSCDVITPSALRSMLTKSSTRTTLEFSPATTLTLFCWLSSSTSLAAAFFDSDDASCRTAVSSPASIALLSTLSAAASPSPTPATDDCHRLLPPPTNTTALACSVDPALLCGVSFEVGPLARRESMVACRCGGWC
mmetsp:Transcript_37934/g.89425  ORF Transcript_37934/g.89425 Transcript_37934/m.89425 type:complete len:206 (-) Transcript_37934:251-868(-)